MKSVMQHSFSVAPSIKAPRSVFDRSFGYKTTFDAGYLIPFLVDDVLPGDTFTVDTTIFARMSSPLYPVMDNMYLDTQFFFVPYRLLWDNAKKFFGEQANPADSIDYTLPIMTAHVPAAQSLSDYLGIMGATATESIEHVSLYHRAYNLIWNEWYRDQNLQNSVVVDTDDGPDDIADYVLLKRGKRHDYFTSCLPWPQKGDAVSMPLGSTAPVRGIGSSAGSFANTSGAVYESGGNNPTYANYHIISAGGVYLEGTGAGPGAYPTIYADLTNATAATINDIREAFQIQKLLERDARGGTRYSEIIANHFGVDFYDVSYRPEFLGGGSTPINTTPVPQTSLDSIAGTTSTVGVGQLGGYTTASANGHGFTKSFVEHGLILGLMSVRADLTYQQGIHRRYLKSTRYDIYWPSLSHLGEQAVTNAEIYYQGTGDDDLVFGYQERYAEYRYYPSMITGKFRSQSATPLDAWHLSQEFGALPTLGNTFIQESPPIDRVVQISTEPDFIMDSYTRMRCVRPMPVFAVPGLIDHF